jgi:tetratricopeptide (TPR) repeat protein
LRSTHYEVPVSRAEPAAIGHEVIYTTGCLMHLTQGVGAPGLASAAMAPWSDWCTENSRDGADVQREVAALRRTVAVAPGYAQADAMLGLLLSGVAQGRPPAEKKALIDEGLAAAARAQRLAPRQGEGYMAEARLRQDTDPVRAEQLYIKASAVGTNLAQAERQQYGFLLERMGRIDDALDQHQRLLAVQPNNAIDMSRVAWGMGVKGQYAGAQQLLAQILKQRTNAAYALQLRLQVALWARDWPTVREITKAAPPGPGSALVDALASGDKARIDSAGAAYESLVADADRISPFAIDALALTGRPKAALEALDRMAGRVGPGVLSKLYEPPFAEARRTPEFEAMATRYGLMDDWKRSGRGPDFCKAPNPPALCRRLAG